MMRTTVLILLLSATAGLTPSMGTELVIEGNSNLSLEAVLETVSIGCEASDSVCIRTMCRAAAERYWEEGYLDARITCESLHPGRDTILITIAEGSVARLGAVRIVGHDAFGSSDLEPFFDDDVGLPFTSSRLERGIRMLLDFYDRHGFPVAGVRPETVSREGGLVEVTLRLDEGRRARVGRVVFDGLTGTRREIVLAESGIAEGDLYDGERIREAGSRLMALGIFESVSEPVLSFGAGDTAVAITFDVEEAMTNRVEGVMAYAPSEEEGKLVGSMDLEFGNIGGTLRRLRIIYDRPGPDRLRWNIDYREPRLAGTSIALEAGVSSDVVETSFARRKLTVGLGLRGDAGLGLSLAGIAGVTKDRSQGGGEGDFSERGASFALRYDGRDRPVSPRSGAFFGVSHEVTALDFDPAEVEDRTLSSLDTEAGLVTEASPGNVLFVGGRYEGVFTSSAGLPPSHIIRLGGAGSLRGYPQEWFSVEQAVVITLEVRHLIGRSSSVYAFADGATLQDGARDLGDLKGFPYGYGVGFTGVSRSGVVRLEIALGRDDGFSDAKLHLGLARRF